MIRIENRVRLRAARSLAALSAAALLLAGCSGAAANDRTPSEPNEQAPNAVFIDGWAKSGEQGGMTGVFGTLENHGDDDLVITAVESEAAGSAELHEVTTAGVMQQISGDVTVPAGGSFEFVPGGDHIMLMDLAADLLAGDEAPITVSFDDGSSISFSAFVKDYSGANESYGDGGHGGSGEHGGSDEHDDHGGH